MATAPDGAPRPRATLATHLALGRVSNLPTVWTNALAAAVLAGAPLAVGPTLGVVLALSLFYVAGMYLNDALDADVDATERPERPIPSGRASVADVKLWATWLFIGGAVALAAGRIAAPGAAGGGSVGWLVAGALLVAAIVLYDRSHKGNPYAPLLMGACRVLAYAVAAYALAGALPLAVVGGATLVFCWLVGLTQAARREGAGRVAELWPLALLALAPLAGLVAAFREPLVWLPLAALVATAGLAARWLRRGGPGDVRRAVGLLIAGICLVDAVLVARTGELEWVVALLIAFGATLVLQRAVSGT